MASKFTPAFCFEFTVILAEKNTKANEVFQQAMACLRLRKSAYNLSKQHCKFFIPHKKNRGGLMLSPYNVHRNAAKIHKAGADIKQIINAVCIELAPSGAHRAAHILANEKLVQRPKGLLAPLSNEVRFLTLGGWPHSCLLQVCSCGRSYAREGFAR